jgi:hypothetical protein
MSTATVRASADVSVPAVHRTAVDRAAVDRAAVERATVDRAAAARAVLQRAEERTGASRWVGPRPQVAATERTLERAAVDDGGLSSAPGIEPEAEARRLPVPSALASLLPSGALDRGSTVVVAGSTSLVLSLLAEASRSGSWVAIVGLPGAGVLAAHQLGLRLDRVALVPAPGPDGPTVVAALLDGVDVVVVGPQAGLDDADRRRLSARARERSAVVLATTPWPGAHVVLTAQGSRWEGLGRGEGRLRTRRLTVQRSGRGTAARPRTDEVTLPAAPPAWGGEERARPAATVVPATTAPGLRPETRWAG